MHRLPDGLDAGLHSSEIENFLCSAIALEASQEFFAMPGHACIALPRTRCVTVGLAAKLGVATGHHVLQPGEIFHSAEIFQRCRLPIELDE